MSIQVDRNVKQFNDLLESAKELPRVEQKRRRDRIAKAVAEKLVANTPRKTGKARGGWGVGVGKGGAYKFTFLGKRNAGLLDFEGRRAPAMMKRAVDAAKWDQDIVFRNNVSYIGLLESGYSRTQAPAGILTPTLIAVRIQFFG